MTKIPTYSNTEGEAIFVVNSDALIARPCWCCDVAVEIRVIPNIKIKGAFALLDYDYLPYTMKVT